MHKRILDSFFQNVPVETPRKKIKTLYNLNLRKKLDTRKFENNIEIKKIYYKGISAGENSNATLYDVKIDDSFLGIASKDNSLITGKNIQIKIIYHVLNIGLVGELNLRKLNFG